MTHFLTIILFAALVGVVFGVMGKNDRENQLKYGLSVFAKFVLAAFVLGWLLYFLPL